MDKKFKRNKIAKRIAKEFKDGDIVNLGIGIPTLVANYIPENINVFFQGENGILGIGPEPEKGYEDKDLINAGGTFITAIKGASYFDTASSFAMIRGGHIDYTVLGALEVDEKGQIANWIIPGKFTPGMGGAMDLLTGAKKVICATEHLNKKGKSKIVKECSLPITSIRKIDLIVTELAVIEVLQQGLLLKEIAKETTLDYVLENTQANLKVSKDLKTF